MPIPITGQELLYLSEAETAALLPPAGKVADEISRLVIGLHNGIVRTHPKGVMTADDMATFFIMATAMPGELAGIKWLGGAPDNPARNIPAFLGLNLLSDAETGSPLAIMGAAATTVLRTAAISLLGARALAARDSRTLGLVGAGMQALAHLKAMREEFSIDHVFVTSVGTTAEQFRDRWSEPGLTIEVVDAETTISQSDIIISAVAADPGLTPFLDARRMKPGSFASMIDLGKPWIVDHLDAFGHIYTDDRRSSEARGRTVEQMGMIRYDGDLNDLCGTEISLAPAARTAMIFAGIPLADFAAASLVYRRAVEQGAGRLMPL